MAADEEDVSQGELFQALPRGASKILWFAEEIMDGPAERPDFLHAVLCQVGLPRSATPAKRFERTNGKKALDQITSATSEEKNRATVGIMLQHRLHLRCQGMESLPHVRDTASQVDADLSRRQHHPPPNVDRTPRSTDSSAAPSTRTRMPFGNSISIRPEEGFSRTEAPGIGAGVGASGGISL
jgi:hypothetical protein